jgi:hypothetical protein
MRGELTLRNPAEKRVIYRIQPEHVNVMRIVGPLPLAVARPLY